MKVKVLRSTIADRKLVEAGDEVDLSPGDAALLVRLGKAEFLDEKAEKPAKKTAKKVKPNV